jgi:two-component system CheB/CheR fusion protein
MAAKKINVKTIPEQAQDTAGLLAQMQDTAGLPEQAQDTAGLPEQARDIAGPTPPVRGIAGSMQKDPDIAESTEPALDMVGPDAQERNASVLQEPSHAAPAEFPIVGIGASAGGLAAFEAFFSAMPTETDTGMAFVLVQHLAPDHKSILTDLIRRYTRMEVCEVEDGMVVKPNCTYIIPPNRDMAFLNGVLHLLEPSAPRGQRLPIDFFFRSLAQDQHEHAICIVLSGTGSDGSLGVRAIKAEGGMVMVQSPGSTEYDGMPRSAIGTGLVDYEMPPAEMPAQLLAYVAHAFGRKARPAIVPAPKTESILRKIFILLRSQTGHDFSQYKISTIHRRIDRRMAVHQIDTLDDYVRYLQKAPSEIEALFRDLLIGVTSFFRDPEAFKALEAEIIPKLFARREPGPTLRIWTPGCSTGEEAYSIAILLQEYQDALRQNYKVQIFATDIDSQAIATARQGRYPVSIVSDISAVRLARYFTLEQDGSLFRINKSIRDMLVFSEQNVIKDPPFSKIDLISCRNLMIYMGSELQKKLIPIFHYALNRNGVLFLGTSETVGEQSSLFTAVNIKMKLYSRRDEYADLTRPAMLLAPHSETGPSVLRQRKKVNKNRDTKSSLRERAEQTMLKHMWPASALVAGNGDILYLHGHTGMFLEPTQGEVGTLNILRMAREGLLQELRATLRKAIELKEPVCSSNVRVKTNGSYTLTNLTICPVEAEPNAHEPPLYLVVMESSRTPEPAQTPPIPLNYEPAMDTGASDSESHLSLLRQELRAKQEFLRAANEELETSNEELKSSNEEMQSMNEELQSTNEELETAKEELQSVNEELSTVNSELQNKVVDLSRTNNDMNNLLSGTGIGTIFVDFQLRIMRFTPAATQIVNLILSDVGRPVAHIVSNLAHYDRMVQDLQEVLVTLVPKAVEVESTSGTWFMMRIQPYRTTENVIEGAVVSFIDISEIVKAREALRKSNEVVRLAVVVRDSNDSITVQDLNGRILAWNPASERMYGWSEDEAMHMNVRDRIPESRVWEEMNVIHQLALSNVMKPYLTQRKSKDGLIMDVWLTSTSLVNEAGLMYAIATTERLKA